MLIERAVERESRRHFGRFQIAPPLRHALEEFVSFGQAADADVLVFQHRFNDAENWFWVEIVAVRDRSTLPKISSWVDGSRSAP